MSRKPHLCLVTPALASANNGNWQTASRWARMLAPHYRVSVVGQWAGEASDAMIALHARRSAASIAAWSRQLVRRPLVVVLTGTDLYRDIAVDARARESLALADRLVVLQEHAPQDLPAPYRAKAIVSFQSCSAWRPLAKTRRRLRALMVGHLRDEKDPRTYFAAARLLAHREDIVLDHIGAGLDEALAREARALAREQPRYRWLGAVPHRDVRARIQRAHVLVHASRMEGGAHVVMEALRSGTPVIASNIAGNVGMLGADYRGYYPVGDAAALAALLQRARDDPAMLAALREQGDARAPLFEPAAERRTLLDLMNHLLEHPPR
jgi:putative glycosyltransferase (TIGR04348 family)